MDEIIDGNGKVTYGKLLQKVDDMQRELCDVKSSLHEIENWKNNLTGKIYIIVAIVCFASTIFPVIVGEIILKALNI